MQPKGQVSSISLTARFHLILAAYVSFSLSGVAQNFPTHTPQATSSRRVITLEEAQAQAAGQDAIARLGQLQVEAARQHRLGAQADFFPKLGATAVNMHFNKFMGEEITATRRLAGGTVTLGFPLAGKDQTLVAATAAQPITPLFKLHQVYKLALADETIARAKAGLPVSETASLIERTYYELMVAQRRLIVEKANTRGSAEWLTASVAAALPAPAVQEENLIAEARVLGEASSRVHELTTSLNEMLGWPIDTELELIPPDLQSENISLREATSQAMQANPEVVEAEQNVVKAKAASSLSKLDYIPDVVGMFGYAYNSNVIPLLPRDFSFYGVMATYNLFDFGKRERTVKERSAQVEMAETALEMTKAKVAAAVRSSYSETDRARRVSELAHRLRSATRLRPVSDEENMETSVFNAGVEAEMYQADLDYRQSLRQLKTLMGTRP